MNVHELYQCVNQVVTLVMTAQTMSFCFSSLLKVTVQKRHTGTGPCDIAT